jgi:hypothetical protein
MEDIKLEWRIKLQRPQQITWWGEDGISTINKVDVGIGGGGKYQISWIKSF